MIRVLVVEDDLFWQNAIEQVLSARGGYEIVGIARSFEQARTVLQQIEADVIVMDLSLGVHLQGGVDLMYEWRYQGLSVPPIFMLTSHDDPQLIAECFASGAANFLCKRDLERLPEALSMLVSGQHGMISYVAQALRLDYQRIRERTDRDQLTRQERTILYHVHHGTPQSRIAEMICVTQRTIKNHINHILKKMNVSSSKEAALRAAKRGWLDGKDLES